MIILKTAQNIYPQMRQLLGPKVKDRIFFLHFPKCGGSSVKSAIRRSFGLLESYRSDTCLDLNPVASLRAAELMGCPLMAYREQLLLYYMASDRCRYICGHFDYSERAFQAFGRTWNFVTLLRHPVSKWISQYFFNKYKKDGHFRIEVDLETFLASEEGIALGSDYVQKLIGFSSPYHSTSDEAVQKAIQNLSHFSLVGILEKLDIFAKDYEALFGSKITIGRRNINPLSKSKQNELITEDIRMKITEICRPDLQIYEAALQQVSHGL